MSKRIIAALGFVGMAATMAAHADETFMDDRFYVAPFGTYFHPGGDRDSADSWGAGLGIGKIINEYFNVELRGFWQNIDGYRYNGDITGGTVDAQYYFFRDTFSPYAVLGVGGINTSAKSLSGASFITEAGVGATYELFDNLLLRGDVRYRYVNDGVFPPNSNDHGQQHDMLVNLGFVVPIGPKPVGAAPVAPAASDECAGRDSDRDGVNDCDDKCPGTLAGSKVDDQGCPIRIELRGVNFELDSDRLTPTARQILDGVAEQLVAYPLKKDIEVRGHTSSEASDAYNMRLSQRRSESVTRYLKDKGVTNKLYPKGYGEHYPIADNSTDAGRRKNRRVELVWVGD